VVNLIPQTAHSDADMMPNEPPSPPQLPTASNEVGVVDREPDTQILSQCRDFIFMVHNNFVDEISNLILGMCPPGCQFVRLETRLKSARSLARVVESKIEAMNRVPYDTSEYVTIDQTIRGIDDVVRFSCVCESADGIVECCEALVATVVASPKLQMVKINNWFFDGNRYKGLHLRIRHKPSNLLFEVQIHFPESLNASVTTHADYEVYRVSFAEMRASSRERIAQVYAMLVNPPELADIEEFSGIPVTHKRDEEFERDRSVHPRIE